MTIEHHENNQTELNNDMTVSAAKVHGLRSKASLDLELDADLDDAVRWDLEIVGRATGVAGQEYE